MGENETGHEPKRKIRIWHHGGWLLSVVYLSMGKAAYADRMQRFEADIRLARSGTLNVTETLQVDFGKTQRHGIYRLLPGSGNKLTLVVRSVTDAKGRPYRFTQARQGRAVQLRIGDADKLVSGAHTYRIRYVVTGAVQMYDGLPQLHWNATGTQWRYPIDAATVRFFPPIGIKATQLRTRALVGTQNARVPAKTRVSAQSVTFASGPVPAGSGLTFWVILPANAIAKPQMRPTPKPPTLSALMALSVAPSTPHWSVEADGQVIGAGSRVEGAAVWSVSAY